jgi:Gpi18-like mannosyltransferase
MGLQEGAECTFGSPFIERAEKSCGMVKGKKETMQKRAMRWLGLSEEQSSRFFLLLIVTVCVAALTAGKIIKQFSSGGLQLSAQDFALLAGGFAFLLLVGALGIAWVYRISKSRWQALVFLQIFCLGLLVRFLLLSSPFAMDNSDIVAYLQPWCAAFRALPIRQALIADVGNYTMPYRMFLAVVSHMPVTDVYCIKLVSVLFDAGTALMLWLLARQLGGGYPKQIAIFALSLLLPTFWLNGAFWGQCDSLYTFLCLLGIYSGIRGKSALCWLMGGIALSMKLQAVFLLPALLILLLSRRIRLRECIFYPLGLFLMNLPALLLGCPLSQILGIYTGQTGAASGYLHWNATTFWTLFPFNTDETIGLVSLVVCGMVLVLLFYLFVDKMPKLDDAQTVLLIALITLTVIYFMPGMHERYFYLAEALMLLYIAFRPGKAWAAGVLYLADFTRYAFYLWPAPDNLETRWAEPNKLETATSIFSAEVQALLLGLAIVWMVVAFYRETNKAASIETV